MSILITSLLCISWVHQYIQSPLQVHYKKQQSPSYKPLPFNWPAHLSALIFQPTQSMLPHHLDIAQLLSWDDSVKGKGDLTSFQFCNHVKFLTNNIPMYNNNTIIHHTIKCSIPYTSSTLKSWQMNKITLALAVSLFSRSVDVLYREPKIFRVS